MEFKDLHHQQAYFKFMAKAKTQEWDRERAALFYLLSLFEETRKNIDQLYDFKENCISFEGLSQPWQTGGTTKVTKLAFNLFNGWYGEDNEDYSPLHLFSVSEDNRPYLLEAIEIRFD